jgi:hypothetical protein
LDTECFPPVEAALRLVFDGARADRDDVVLRVLEEREAAGDLHLGRALLRFRRISVRECHLPEDRVQDEDPQLVLVEDRERALDRLADELEEPVAVGVLEELALRLVEEMRVAVGGPEGDTELLARFS